MIVIKEKPSLCWVYNLNCIIIIWGGGFVYGGTRTSIYFRDEMRKKSYIFWWISEVEILSDTEIFYFDRYLTVTLKWLERKSEIIPPVNHPYQIHLNCYSITSLQLYIRLLSLENPVEDFWRQLCSRRELLNVKGVFMKVIVIVYPLLQFFTSTLFQGHLKRY